MSAILYTRIGCKIKGNTRIYWILATRKTIHGILSKNTGGSMSEEFLTIPEIAKKTHVTEETVRVWIREKNPEKRLPAYKVGRSYLVRKDEFEAWFEKHRTDEQEI
jgi:excisionase family DNA binding protein